MDTRSVLRSRRRSTRLTGQPLDDERVKRTNTGKRRDSDHDTSATSSDVSRESSCVHVESGLKKAPLDHGARADTPDTNDNTTSGGAKDRDIMLPLFPNLRASKPKATHDTNDKTHVNTAPAKAPVDTTSEEVAKGHLSTKWVKTARGSIRLAIDSPEESAKHVADKKDGGVKGGKHASFATARRQSTRLTSMTPDVEDSTVELEPMSSQHAAKQTKTFATGISFPDPAPCDEGIEPEPVSQDSSALSTSEQDRDAYATNDEELPTQGHTAQRAPKSPEVRKNMSPIPELVADIEKIVQSSPLADRNWTSGGTQGTISSTPSEALKKRGHTNMITRTRMLRSSSRSVGDTSKGGEIGGAEQSDSESSQLDGAFDDSIRGRRKKAAQGVRGAVNTSKTSVQRGTKRSARELSQDEGRVGTTRARRRRKPNSDGLKLEADLSSANPIEAATSRGTFSADGPGVEDPNNIGEPTRRGDEPASTDSTIPSKTDDAADATPADNGSQGATASQDSEEDSHKCAHCGREPARHLVCAKCKEAIYCGKYCQLWEWPLHTTGCHTSDEADQVEIEQQEAYLGGMWAAALRMLSEEDIAGGTVESLMLEEAVRHSPARPMFMGQGSSHGLVGFDLDAFRLALPDSRSLDRTRAMSMRLAQAAQGGEEWPSEAE